VFETSTGAALQGVYRFHVLASGITLRGLPFTREQDLTGAVVPGGDGSFPTSGPSTQGRDKQLCELLECLLGPDALGRFLSEHKVKPDAIRACIEQWCKARLGPPSEEELRQREGTDTSSTQGGKPTAITISSEQIALLTEILRKAQP